MLIINCNDEALSLLPWTFFYQKVEWIWTSWTQFINTNLFAQSNHQIETKIAVNRTIASWDAVSLFWSYWNVTPPSQWASLWNYLHLTTLNNKWYIWRNNSEVNWWSFSWTIWNVYTVVFNDSSSNVVVNWSTVWSSSWCVNYPSTTLAISVRWTTQQSRINWWYYNFYYFKIYDKNTWKYVREMIPCYRKSDNVIWMFDTVNKVFYTNNGTWSFTKWPDVN